jgi:uncharacterized NAD(P)/FAD-binding protein YdhS
MDCDSVAIAGGGCSGLLVAAQLFRQGFRGSVAIVEPRPALGRGLAYSTPYDEHLLNVPAGKMSALPTHPSHFLDWLRAGRFPNASAAFFAPRKVYGEYLESVLERETGDRRGSLTHIRAEVATVRSDGSGAELTLGGHSTIRAGRVVLAIGNPASSPALAASHLDMQGLDMKGQWCRSPWLDDALRVRYPDERILLIGTGLTAVDAALAMQGQSAGCQIYMLSRRGILAHVHNLALAPADPPEFRHRGHLRPMFRQLREIVGAMRESDLCWRIAIDSLRPTSNQMWQELPAGDRLRFVRHLKTYWETHRHRMAPEVGQRMDRYRTNGAVQVIAGRLREVRREGHAIMVRIGLRQGGERLLEVDRVINCTGIHESYVDHPRPLIASLIQSGLACANDLGIGFRTDSGGALLDASGGPSPILFTLGPPRRGDLIETTAVPEIRAQAEALARRLLA